MEIEDLSIVKENQRNNHWLLPKSIRGLIIGKSGCGKTTLLLNLLLKNGWLDYDTLYCFGKSLHQPEYQIIKKGFDNNFTKKMIFKLIKYYRNNSVKDISNIITKLGETLKLKPNIKTKFFTDSSEIPDPSELNSKNKNLLIFDDIMLEKQNKIEDYYTRGRHNNVDCFYVAQNYFKLPRQTIRENTNLIILFKQDGKNLNNIHQDHCTDISLKEFTEFCNKCWAIRHGFAIIDLNCDNDFGKYKRCFDEFYIHA